MNRRTFLSSLAVAGTAVAASSSGLFAADSKSKPKVGLVGCGWYGWVDLEAMVQHAEIEIVSLCDPNAKALKATLEKVAEHQKTVPKTFADYRQMLASGPHDIVIVATPDHWHTLPAIAAMQAGADVYLEKPISCDVIEGEALVAAARKYNRVVQVNTQRRSTRCLAEARDKYIRSGKIGTIGLVQAYSYLTGRPPSVLAEANPPAHLDYDLWTGPAPLLPFHPVDESRVWRAFKEYGNGQIGDLGVHMFDCVRWMMDLGWPKSISSSGGIYVDRKATANISDTQMSVFRYPELDVSWEHRTWGSSPIPARHWTDQWGARFIGKNGTLNITILGYDYTPADGGPREGFHMLSKTGNLENIDFNHDTASGEIQKWHTMDFMKARETRSRPVADVEEGHISTASCILANLAQELGRPLVYDPKTRTIPGDPEATARLTRTYRAPWAHPDPLTV
ncbi:MAG TPA: Gfo/Idh/MocA family oxidoreductase [Lacunisphaera sp.]|jgi:predicted dehydrogenase